MPALDEPQLVVQASSVVSPIISVPGSQASINALPTVARRPEAITVPITASVWCTDSIDSTEVVPPSSSSAQASWAEAAIDAAS